jgi:hypothetical protein
VIPTGRNIDKLLTETIKASVLGATNADDTAITTKDQLWATERTKKLPQSKSGLRVGTVVSFVCLEPISKTLDTFLLVLDEAISHYCASATCFVLTPSNFVVKVIVKRCHWKNSCAWSTALDAVNPKLNLLVNVSFKGPIGSLGFVIFLFFFVIGGVI